MKKGLIAVGAVLVIDLVTIVQSVSVVDVFGNMYLSRQSDEPGFDRFILDADQYCGKDVMCKIRIEDVAKRDAYFKLN